MTVGELIVRVKADTEDLDNGLKDSIKNVKSFGDNVKSLIAGGAIAAGFAKLGSEIIKLGRDYQNASSNIARATGATGDKLADLNRDFSGLLKMGITKGIDDISTAFGEVNTRFGLTGDALNILTKQFSDFATITGTDTTKAVQDVSKILEKFDVPASDAGELMDKLAVAAQNSGININTLTTALITGGTQLQNMGFSLDDSIALLATFEEQGVNSQTVIMGFNTAVKKFADEGKTASQGFEDFRKNIELLQDPTEKASYAIGVFGTRAGPEIVRALGSGDSAFGDFKKAIESATEAVTKTLDASRTFDERMLEISNRIAGTWGSLFAGLIEGAGNFAASIGEFLFPDEAQKRARDLDLSVKAARSTLTNTSTTYEQFALAVTNISKAIGATEKEVYDEIIRQYGHINIEFSTLNGAMRRYKGELDQRLAREKQINETLKTQKRIEAEKQASIKQAEAKNRADAENRALALARETELRETETKRRVDMYNELMVLQKNLDDLQKAGAIDEKQSISDKINALESYIGKVIDEGRAGIRTAEQVKLATENRKKEVGLLKEQLEKLESAQKKADESAIKGNDHILDQQEKKAQGLLAYQQAMIATGQTTADQSNKILDSLGKVQAKTEEAKEAASEWDKAVEGLNARYGDLNSIGVAGLNAGLSATQAGLKGIGEAIATGKHLWESLGIAAVDIMVQVLQAIGAQLAGMAVIKVLAFDFAGAGAAIAGSIAAYAAAGVIGTWKPEMPETPAYATGTDWASGGMAMVGERGPEMVRLPAGSRVQTNESLGSKGSGYIENKIYIDGRLIAQKIAPYYNKNIVNLGVT